MGIADSGIDFTHEAFRNQDGTTRILNLWDQTNDRIYSAEEINEALKSENPYELVNSVDYSGHGTHVAGIAAGNFAENKNDNLGIATKSSLVIVKLALAGERSFPRTTQLMEAVDYMIKVAESYKMPLAMNLSFGNSYGSHDGTSLISTYLDSMADGRRVSICVGAGNEGDSAGHVGGYVFEPTDVEVQVSRFQKAFSIQLWKNFSDEFRVQIIAPSVQMPEGAHAHRFADLLKRARAARHGDKGVAKLDHFRAALRHRFGHNQLVDCIVLQFRVDEELRLHARDAAACGERAFRQNAHQAGLRAAIDERMAVFTNPRAKLAHRLFERGVVASVRAEIYRYVHCKTSRCLRATPHN